MQNILSINIGSYLMLLIGSVQACSTMYVVLIEIDCDNTVEVKLAVVLVVTSTNVCMFVVVGLSSVGCSCIICVVFDDAAVRRK
jgi:hypothetical protein